MINSRFVKKSIRQSPKLTLVLLDWSVRESFHVLYYLSRQTVKREDFEIVVIEYYDRISSAVEKFEEEIDSWIVLGMPRDCHYHKHLMYNAGIAIARGEIVTICDSDAMVKETFVESIIEAFENRSAIVLHLDQFRNTKKKYYPFCYPTFEEVTGNGCVNFRDGKTTGIVKDTDPIHDLNYGACMSALRNDLIAIGGADEHIDYLGHICGPYDMTFRLTNSGHEELWHQSEFTYHTWHPGQAGANNYMGPHDTRHMSLAALDTLVTKRIFPKVANIGIKTLRKRNACSNDYILSNLVDRNYLSEWSRLKIRRVGRKNVSSGNYLGYRYVLEENKFKAWHIISGKEKLIVADTLDELQSVINTSVNPELQQTTTVITRRIGRFQLYKTLKEFLYNIVSHIYRALKFRDKHSLLALVRMLYSGPVELVIAISNHHLAVQKLKGRYGSIAALIFRAQYGYESTASRPNKAIVLVSDRSSVRVLQMLKNERNLLPFESHIVRNAGSIEEILNRPGMEYNQCLVIVWSEIYTCFHNTFRTSTPGKQLLIV